MPTEGPAVLFPGEQEDGAVVVAPGDLLHDPGRDGGQPYLPRRCASGDSEPVDAGVDVGAGSLDDPIGVEEQPLPWLEDPIAHGELGILDDAESSPAGVVDGPLLGAGVPVQDRRVAGAADLVAAGDEVDDHM